MGYNVNCYSQYCWAGCCDVWGYCPSYTSNCYYYYSSDTSSSTTSTSNMTGMIIGVTVGPILGMIALVIILTCVFRRCRKNNLNNGGINNNVNDSNGTTMIIVNDPNNPAYGQPVNNSMSMNNNNYQYNSYGAPNTQPVYQAPLNPYPQPYPYQQPPVYNPQPAYFNTPQPQQPIIIV